MPALIRRPFVFLRHGQSDYNRQGLVAGSRDVPLTAQGEAEARRAYALLGDVAWPLVVSSPLERARCTAELASGRSPDRLIAGLMERHWGMLEGRPILCPMPYLTQPEDGESWAQFVSRIVTTLNAVLDSAGVPLVVGHSGLTRVIRYLDSGSPEGPRIANAVPQWIAPVGSDGWRMRPLTPENTAHLPRHACDS